jgi:hypothetical protein
MPPYTEYFILLGVAVVLLLAYAIANRVNPKFTFTRFFQIFLAASGILGAFTHIFSWTHKEGEEYPVVDFEALAWLALVPIAWVLPRIKKGKWGELEIELESAAKIAVDAVDKIADLLQDWTGAVNITLDLLRTAQDDAERQRVLIAFLRDRMGEAKEAMEGKSDEPDLRLSVWSYDADDNRIRFFYSNEIGDEATLAFSFAVGEGMVGQSWLEQRTWNEANALQLPSYIPIVPRARYRAVYCTPITFGQHRHGMLCMDKNEEKMFADRADTIARSLAAILATLFEEYNRPVSEVTEEGGLALLRSKIRDLTGEQGGNT